MTDQHWNEFLDKLDYAQLTSRWATLPLHWLDDHLPERLDSSQEILYRGLLALPKDGDAVEREARVQELVRAYRRSRAAETVSLPPSLTPPGSRVTLRHLDPEELGQGDCLITVGNWDRLGYFIAQQAGLAEETSEPSENPLRKDPGQLPYRHLLIFPDKGTPSPRSFRSLCEKTLRQARGLGARRIAITHLHLPQPGLPDRFAAAELVSAVRQMLRDGGGITVDILPLTNSTFEDYRHWFVSLAGLSGAESEPGLGSPEPEVVSSAVGSEPILAEALRDFAQRTSSLAQEASRGVTSWLKASWEAASAASPPPVSPPVRKPAVVLEPTFEEQQALNLLYLRRWQEAEAFRACWEKDSLLGLYLSALYSVVAFIETDPVEPLQTPQPEEPVEAPKPAKKKGKSKKKRAVDEADEAAAAEQASQEPAGASDAASAPPETALPAEPAEKPEPSPTELESLRLRQTLLATADDLGAENPLSRYFQLLAWRLDWRRPDSDPDQLEEDHARLLRAAWAWDDQAMLTFLRSAMQDRENEQPKALGLGYVPVFPVGSRTAPQLD